jgi:hypothetical protein
MQQSRRVVAGDPPAGRALRLLPAPPFPGSLSAEEEFQLAVRRVEGVLQERTLYHHYAVHGRCQMGTSAGFPLQSAALRVAERHACAKLTHAPGAREGRSAIKKSASSALGGRSLLA